jgi:hypothetical protein
MLAAVLSSGHVNLEKRQIEVFLSLVGLVHFKQ